MPWPLPTQFLEYLFLNIIIRSEGEQGPAGASEPLLNCAEPVLNLCGTCAEPTQLAKPKVQNKPKAKNEMCKI